MELLRGEEAVKLRRRRIYVSDPKTLRRNAEPHGYGAIAHISEG